MENIPFQPKQASKHRGCVLTFGIFVVVAWASFHASSLDFFVQPAVRTQNLGTQLVRESASSTSGRLVAETRQLVKLHAADNDGGSDETSNAPVAYSFFAIAAVAAGLAFAFLALSGQGDNFGPLSLLAFGAAVVSAAMRSTAPVDTSDKPSAAAGEAGREAPLPSIASLTAAEWAQKYERSDQTVSLWTEDNFSYSSRAIPSGIGTGEGPSQGGVPIHRVQMTDRQGHLWDLQVPEDRYVLWEAEDHGMKLPFACRAGCCTTCAVKIDSGVMVQDQALGIAPEYRQQGYGLMCVGYPKSDLVMHLVEEDELYEKQFGEAFSKSATSPKSPAVKRDDFALEIALGDE
eukprot:EG_transcript_13066